MKEFKDSKKIKNKGSDDYLDKLPSRIDEEDIPLQLLLSQVFRLVNEIKDKIKKMDEKLQPLSQLTDTKRQIKEIHELHFAAKHLQSDKSLVDKYLAEILIGKSKRRK